MSAHVVKMQFRAFLGPRPLVLSPMLKLDNLILCLDQERACADGDLPTGARVVHYRRRIDPTAVLRAAGHVL
jgi:hypothetical protein